jgi:nitroreductase
VDLASFSELARARRTHMVVDTALPVDPALVDELCALATWAPNHKRTWPWRFAALTGDARAELGEAFVTDMVAVGFGDAGKHAKTRTKYTRTPTIVVVASAPHDNPQLHDENAYAVAAGVQNLLLGATAAGLASFWSTPPLPDSPSVLALCGFDPADRIIAVIYLGWPAGGAATPERPEPQVTHLA